MLRARVSRQESSICAFCEHRLSLRLSAPRGKRHFSSTNNLGGDDGWGGWGGGFKPRAPPQQDDFLTQHELSARQKLLEKQQAQKAPEPPKPEPANNGLQARYVWNAEKQQAVEANLRKDGMSLRSGAPFPRREPGNPSMTGTYPRISRGTPPPNESYIVKTSPSSPSSLPRHPLGRSNLGNGVFGRYGIGPQPPGNNSTPPLPGNNSDPAAPTRWEQRFRSPLRSTGQPPTQLRPQPPTQPPIQPTFSPINEPTSQLKKDPVPEQKSHEASQATPQATSQTAQPASQPSSQPSSQPTFGSKFSAAQNSGDDSGWGLLARKQTPKNSSDDFWAYMGRIGGRESANPPKTEASEQASTKSISAVDITKETDDSDEVEAQAQSTTEKDVSKTAQATSEAEVEEILDRGRGQDKWAKKEGRGKGARDKRSRRGSRFSNDEEDDGFDYDDYQERRRLKAQRRARREAEKSGPTPIMLPELIGIPQLAEALGVEPNLFLTQLGELGFEDVTMDSLMAGETAALVAQEYGFEPTVEIADRDLKPRPPPEDPSTLPQRPPVVTIMGHVDHGKTTLLDYLRKSSIAAQEHGGITQRIGAFSVKLSSGKPITFLDTPGHAAFLTMRQRGAYVTDIVVLVVAADDSVKPQTIEAIKHAREAKVPMIVAISKIDTDGAHVDQVKHDLAREGVDIEDFGGDVQVVCVSGITGQGMDDLEENILTLSEVLDHRAEVDGLAEGWVLESSVKPIGKAATVLVKRGTLRPGDYIVAGLTWAKIRHLRNEAGTEVDEAPPGTPVEILGWKDLPAAGDQILQAPSEGRAREAVQYREGLYEREKDAAAQVVVSEARRTLQERRARERAAKEAEEGKEGGEVVEPLPEEENGAKMVNFVVKGDLHGSVEAVCAAILELGNHEVRPRILRSGTGAIHEFDVEHAAASNSIIINFATTTPPYIKGMAERQGVEIRDYNIIYRLVDDVKDKLSEYLPPDISSHVLGEAEVLQIFPINIKGRKYKNIAGCRVRYGVVEKNRLFRVLRNGKKIFAGKCETLKQFKKDITEVRKGSECGIGFEEFQDFRVGDQIQAYEEIKTERSL